MSDESDLIELARKGHTEAFTELVRIHQGRVRAFLGRYFRDLDTIDDMAQDVFLAAYRDLGRLQADLPMGPWLLGIARNRALDRLRSEARRRSRETRWRVVWGEWKVEHLEQTPEAIDPSHEMQSLERCLKSLPQHSSRLVTEYYFLSRPAAEIAREAGKKESGIRMTLLRIRQALRECIESQRNAVPES